MSKNLPCFLKKTIESYIKGDVMIEEIVKKIIHNKWIVLIGLICTLIGGLAAIDYFLKEYSVITTAMSMTILGIFVVIEILIFIVAKLWTNKQPPIKIVDRPCTSPEQTQTSVVELPNTANPFGQQRLTNPALFFGRENLLREIFNELRNGNNVSLVGDTGTGKSSILSMICERGYQYIDIPKEKFVHLDMQSAESKANLFEALCTELEVPPSDAFQLSRRLKGKRYIVCLDEMESLAGESFFPARNQLRALANGADMPFTLVVASRSRLDELFPIPQNKNEPSSLANIFRTFLVEDFSQEEVRAFIQTRLQPTGIQFTDAEIDTIWQQTNGHPDKVQQAAAELYRQCV